MVGGGCTTCGDRWVGMTERIDEAAAGRRMPPPLGPSRSELLALLS